jgi:D-3-phosphoglycerate dehydrogenase
MKILLAHTPSLRENYYGDKAISGLKALGAVIFHESETALSPTELIAAAKDVDLIVADRLTTVPKIVFDSLPNLKAVLRCAVDVRNIDIDAASQNGILVTHAKPGFVESVAELIFGFLVDLSRGVSQYVNAYKAGKPLAAKMGQQLSGSKIGIIGFGAIARHTAEIAHTLGMQIVIYDPYVGATPTFVQKVGLDEILKSSDYVVCLAVATQETESLMNIDRFKLMKKSAFFINPSRGNLVDEQALLYALQNHLIAGAALDVGRYPEQMPNPSIALLPNVIATPHIGGLTPPAILAQALDTVEQVEELTKGTIPHGSLNQNEWTRKIH